MQRPTNDNDDSTCCNIANVKINYTSFHLLAARSRGSGARRKKGKAILLLCKCCRNAFRPSADGPPNHRRSLPRAACECVAEPSVRCQLRPGRKNRPNYIIRNYEKKTERFCVFSAIRSSPGARQKTVRTNRARKNA